MQAKYFLGFDVKPDRETGLHSVAKAVFSFRGFTALLSFSFKTFNFKTYFGKAAGKGNRTSKIDFNLETND